ncbi:LysR family transcriptional regulator [Halodesulfovibrio spirochaetisodalis]|uniref:LysR family transcriptional regulator n=1 Tax=Halodesulfovibrio spirochaetisodalis TaxID=1560234 RepID=UPI0009ECD41C|nr:LysR family transcriptional regulator [Halodesulfovibrio spirochaetisodalis]
MKIGRVNLASVNLNLLVALKALLDEGNVTRAASRLNITQSGMSKNLRHLRELFDDPLLVRSGNNFALTERAVELSQNLERILGEVTELLDRSSFEPAECTRTFTFATSDYVAEYIFPQVLESYRKIAPNISIQLEISDSTTINALSSGEYDLVTSMLDSQHQGLHHLVIGRDQFACCMRKDHPLMARGGGLSLDEYCSLSHAAITGGGDKVQVIDAELAKIGKRRTVQFSAPLYTTVCKVISRSDMIATMPSHIASNLAPEFDLAWCALPFYIESFDYTIAWHERQHHDASHIWFRNVMLQQIQSSLYSHMAQEAPVDILCVL